MNTMNKMNSTSLRYVCLALFCTGMLLKSIGQESGETTGNDVLYTEVVNNVRIGMSQAEIESFFKEKALAFAFEKWERTELFYKELYGHYRGGGMISAMIPDVWWNEEKMTSTSIAVRVFVDPDGTVFRVDFEGKLTSL